MKWTTTTLTRAGGQDRAQHPFLRQRQGSAQQEGSTGFRGNQACLALSRVALRPAEHGGSVQSHDPVDLALGQAQQLPPK